MHLSETDIKSLTLVDKRQLCAHNEIYVLSFDRECLFGLLHWLIQYSTWPEGLFELAF